MDEVSKYLRFFFLNYKIRAQFTKELLRKTNTRLHQNMRNTSEISYLHLDPEETHFKKTLSTLNHTQDFQNNSHSINNNEPLPNFYSKSHYFF